MKPINKHFGFFLLIFISVGHIFGGNLDLAAAFFIAALFYEAIKQ